MMGIGLQHYLTLGAILFALSVAGIFINRRNLILLLMCIELMLLAVNFNFIAFSRAMDDLTGQIFVFFVMTVAAAEAAIGLAIRKEVYRRRGAIQTSVVRAPGLQLDVATARELDAQLEHLYAARPDLTTAPR